MRDPKNNLNSLKKESEKSLEVFKNSINKEKINERFHFLEVILNVKYAKPPSNNKLTTPYVIAIPYI